MSTSQSVVLPVLEGDRPATTDEIAEFADKGHALVRGLATPAEVAAFRPVIRGAAERHSTETRPLEERETYGKAFLQVPNLWEVDDDVKGFTLAARFARVAAELLQVEGVRLYHDQALFKEAQGGKTPWHQDQFYWPIEGPVTITMWMPLVDVGFESGSMTFASGTHRRGHLAELAISDASDARYGQLVESEGLQRCNYGSMTAGDATFHAGWTLHSAPPNQTGAMREVMTVIYFADGVRAREPRNRYHAADLGRWLPGVRPGDLAASPLNPLLWPVDVTC
jgi:ectoine hydroxylase-related dioxygenase (phytanoyl-CoA dioxygenase family)